MDLKAFIAAFMQAWNTPADPRAKTPADILLYSTPVVIAFIDKWLPELLKVSERQTHVVIIAYVIGVVVLKFIVKITTNDKKQAQ